ncbi:MAG: hypothetical protein M1818_007415 [Claussenomyces sp. TS43310]|nr:MAG: hypothetical protein M1818_007415 [Claussenomyces sp. TS43310]
MELQSKPNAKGSTFPFMRIGTFELYNVARHALKLYNNVGVTAQYVLPLDLIRHFAGIENLIYHVLKRVIQRHPALSLCIDDETSNTPLWIRPGTIDLSQIVRFRGNVSREVLITESHNAWLDQVAELPLWRIVVGDVLPDQPDATQQLAGRVVNVGFFFHHAIGDGTSGVAFHLSFLETLKELAAEDAPVAVLEPVLVPPEFDLLPALEAHNLSLTTFFLARQIFADFMPKRGDNQLWTGPIIQRVVAEAPKTCSLLLSLTHAVSSSVAQLCRDNKTTITPLLTYLVARILGTVYPSYSQFSGAIPYSVRKFTGTSNSEIVLQVSGTHVHFSTVPSRGFISCAASEEVDWDAVRACRSTIESAAGSSKNHVVSLLPYIGAQSPWLAKKLGTRRSGSFEVSNLGMIDGELNVTEAARSGSKGTAPGLINSLAFSQPANILNEPYCFSVASVKGGEMVIVLNWQEGILEEETAKAVMRVLEMQLIGLVSPDEDAE